MEHCAGIYVSLEGARKRNGALDETLPSKLLPNSVTLAVTRRDEERFKTPKTHTIRHISGLIGMH